MAYSIVFSKQATKTMRKVPPEIARTILLKFQQVAENPFVSHPNITKLQDREGFRLRIGDWRVIYDIQKDKVLIFVIKIGLRGEVYR
jgi:mRNA interferase RelE/StbE